tara:strand:+ start:173 stop:568 length:396 start_codon:yes stop_codon:yes gene_type:complete
MLTFLNQCSRHTFTSLFPNDVKNRGLVIFVNMLHMLGVLAIQFGILLPPSMMKYYIIYLVLLLVSYILLNNRCFMTEISNYIGGKNYNTLCIKLSDAKKILVVYLVLAIIFEIVPELSFYSLLTNFAKKNV